MAHRMTPDAVFMPRSGRDWAACAALAAAYLGAGKLGLSLALVNPSATAVWPPSGIALAAALVLGRRVWPGIALGAFLTNLSTAGGVATSTAIALGNTLEALLGSALVRRFAGGASAFERPQDVFLFLGLAALTSTAASATIGSATLLLAGLAPRETAAEVWLTWWLGDAGGIVTLAPALILWGSAERRSLERPWELASAAAALVLSAQCVFGGWLPEPLKNAPLASLCIPALIWIAFRFGPRETALASLALSVLASIGTVRGLGPFAREGPNLSLLLLEIFIATASVLALAFAAAVGERRRAEAALRRAYESLDVQVKQRTDELSKANAELQMFGAVVSHDLQEPLHKILSFTDLLRTRWGARLDESGRDLLERMRRSAQGMARLVDDLLSLSRVMRDRHPFEKVDLNAVLKEVLADLEERLRECAGTVESERLPTLKAHPTQMRQLLQNLLSNALKYRDKARAPVIKVACRAAQPGFVEITVEDNGVGFDERQGERIFEPFVRLHSKGEYPGSGIGLAICRRISLRHGGLISAQGAPGKGAAFTVTLPVSS